jgi:hypothetical protein
MSAAIGRNRRSSDPNSDKFGQAIVGLIVELLASMRFSAPRDRAGQAQDSSLDCERRRSER